MFPKHCVWNEGDGRAARWGSPSPSPDLSPRLLERRLLLCFVSQLLKPWREGKSLPVGIVLWLCPQRGLFPAVTHQEPGMVRCPRVNGECNLKAGGGKVGWHDVSAGSPSWDEWGSAALAALLLPGCCAK